MTIQPRWVTRRRKDGRTVRLNLNAFRHGKTESGWGLDSGNGSATVLPPVPEYDRHDGSSPEYPSR